jgi:putative redox protein
MGGDASGPAPYDFLMTGLGACTSMTMRMYADLKAFPLEHIQVELQHEKIEAADCEQCETSTGKVDRIKRKITLSGDLTPEQEQRILKIANKCPVHRTLKSEILIETDLAD